MTDRIPTVRIPVPRNAAAGSRARSASARWDRVLMAALWQGLIGLGIWWMSVPAVVVDDHSHDCGRSDLR